ncbi:hypothetical protein HBA92_19695 [Ochrobactrum sp. MR28]|nr:hypothetical protein [Ochrobactrum sp. MR28]MBX8817249.1 hypothetical protein [Ochrobactrum sp. MR31]
MEKGFYHPDIGYWQAVGGDPKIEDYRTGTIEVPLKPSENHHWQNGEWVYVEPEPEPEAVISIPAVTFWERTTEAEGSAIEAMLNQQPFRIRQIFMAAQSYRSDHELWPLLQSAAISLFGEERALELLSAM